MPRFVILLHELPPEAGRPTHWDLMLEEGGVLRTWALAAEPRILATIAAEQLPDHRLAYLTYEGEVSAGRGRVTRWDDGEYAPWPDAEATLAVVLRGQRLKSVATWDGAAWKFGAIQSS